MMSIDAEGILVSMPFKFELGLVLSSSFEKDLGAPGVGMERMFIIGFWTFCTKFPFKYLVPELGYICADLVKY
jgi:hypothetical protein